jgi:hypothetical protein
VHWALGLSVKLVKRAGVGAGWMDRETVLRWVGFFLLAPVLGKRLDWLGWCVLCGSSVIQIRIVTVTE